MGRPLVLVALVLTTALLFGTGGMYLARYLDSKAAPPADEMAATGDGSTEDPQPEDLIAADGARPGLAGREAARAAPDDGVAEEAVDEEVVTEEPVISGTAENILAVGEPNIVDSEPPIEFWPWEPRAHARTDEGEDEHQHRQARVDQTMSALYWLKAHQSPDGGWEASGFHSWCKGERIDEPSPYDPNLGDARRNVGVTGLALCAYLGAGYTNRGKHPFKKTVSKGLRYLKNTQDVGGCFGKRDHPLFMHDHAFAALAMMEAYAMTNSPIFKGSAQRALNFATATRNPRSGWGLGVRDGMTDTLTTGLMMFAVKSAMLMNKDLVDRGREPRLEIDQTAFDGVLEWMDGVTDFETGRVGYMEYGDRRAGPRELPLRFPSDASRTTTALGFLARVYAGHDPRKSDLLRASAAEIGSRLPSFDPERGTIDAMYWWTGSLATYVMGGRSWKAWQQTFEKELLDTQRQDEWYCGGKGSWDPAGVWGAQLGRVGTTALLTICLEVYYRYEGVFGYR